MKKGENVNEENVGYYLGILVLSGCEKMSLKMILLLIIQKKRMW